MANERDTDRMAGDLLKALLGSANKPSVGTGQVPLRPQVDERSMLDTIKNFLNQSLPGTKEQEKPNATPASPGVSQTPSAANAAQSGGWEALFRRQEQEREAMHGRHDRERAEMEQRHTREMEAAMRGDGVSGDMYSGQLPRNPPPGPTYMQSSRERRRPGLGGAPGL